MAGPSEGDVADTIAWRDGKHAGETFFVYANQGKTEEWRRQPSKANLLRVVQSPDVFYEVSSSADPGVAPKALLSERFGTDDQDEVLMRILQEGDIKPGDKSRVEKFQRGKYMSKMG